MKQLNVNIEIIGIEATAQSRVLLAISEDAKQCLTVVTDGEQAIPQDQLYDVDKVISFNAFNPVVDADEKRNLKDLLMRKLSDESVEKINTILA
jgi:hypothetical protein